MGAIGNNVNFFFLNFAMDKSDRIDTSNILILIREPVVRNYSFL